MRCPLREKTELYRHFDADGVLLYVGVSVSAIARLGNHMKDSHWANQIVNVTIERFDTRKECLKAELEAIRNERPLHNQKNNRQRLPRVQRCGSTLCASQIADTYGIKRTTFYNMLKDGRFSVPSIPGTDPRRWRVVDVIETWGPWVGRNDS